MTRIKTFFIFTTLFFYLLWHQAAIAEGRKAVFSLKPIASEPRDESDIPTDSDIASIRETIANSPQERRHRFTLVRALIKQQKLEDALVAAKAWRESDAYNLVVVRMMGDILSELSRAEEARRTYSAVVELLPKDASAHRALATVLKQSGDVSSAYQRLKSASRLRPEDGRLLFELADAADRDGRSEEASAIFRRIIDDADSPSAIRYPAKQRLAQLLNAERVSKLKTGDQAGADALGKTIRALNVKGGAVNDIKIFLSWDTDGSDVDLWVTNPAGEKIFYSHKTGKFGGNLYDDVTTGYGPESFTATNAHLGKYLIQVNYFGSNRSAFPEARGEVTVVLKEGTPDEEKFRLPYRLFKTKQTVTVAEITVQ